ncbi:hypothetical protein RhiirA1_388082 [Rhizophagus irregularis]|uniref:Uncharacterized protein n=1 Tax=Rhizophagus irregularis TaxID=588596 RepID=A0A2N0SG18_9GLOM|nr:hypothetical protein RhiirA1_388082 [Rhizophagus irregularis]
MNLVLKKKEIINLKSYLVGSQELREQLQLALASCESNEEENGILQIFFHNTLRGHDKKRLRVKEPGSSILLAAADNNTVELSSIIYEMLMSNKYKPDPHSEFTSLLNVKVSSKITTKNLGRPPKHFIEGLLKQELPRKTLRILTFGMRRRMEHIELSFQWSKWSNGKNQIEEYLDAVFCGTHEAKIDKTIKYIKNAAKEVKRFVFISQKHVSDISSCSKRSQSEFLLFYKLRLEECDTEKWTKGIENIIG